MSTAHQTGGTPTITYYEALAAFETAAEMARRMGVSRASVAEWKEKGALPEGRVWQLIAMRPDKFGHLNPAAA